MTTEKPCPYCENGIAFDIEAKHCKCDNCGRNFDLEHDADFEDGMLRDRTLLIERKKTVRISLTRGAF